ncbi:MAG TPA: HAD-IIA family hydrolase [Candidatus Eisenbergiella merdavium]|uniref:Acid sugar phosphatase n=1 Tax=Candidatus Eisenbergiella merdavium TaxID=2838551 RepID=A0A9D2NJD9_9FIRM|nr:HAD-IIA family hydrolase [Candidatus Eisenbergiella merdavium]
MTDLTGKNADALSRKKLWLLDMDGTIYNENQIFDGTLDFLARIRQQGGRYVFITNNSSRSVADYVKKVNAMGIEAGFEDFYTSSQATAMYIKKNYPGQTVYCMGTRSLVEELRQSGLKVVTQADASATVVLIGFDTENTSEKIRDTCIMLGRDVAYLATNPDLVCPVSFGFIPDCGSMSIMLKNATGKEPFFIGKPQPIMVDCVLQNTGISREEAVIVGDRLYTDIATGINAGVDTICVLSGEASMQDIQEWDKEPDWIFRDVRQIWKTLRKTAF